MLITKSWDDDRVHVAWGAEFSQTLCLARRSVAFHLPEEVRNKARCVYCFKTSGLIRSE